MRLKTILLIALAAISLALPAGSHAEEKSPYPNELVGYKLYDAAKWKTLTPLVSTIADVRKTMGKPAEEKDIAHYVAPYSGDAAAEMPIFVYAVDADWEVIFYFVKSVLSAPKGLRDKVPDLLYKIDLIPKRKISFKEITCPEDYRMRESRTIDDGSREIYSDGSGLAYEIYSSKTRYGKHEPGDLDRISYGPSYEVVKSIISK